MAGISNHFDAMTVIKGMIDNLVTNSILPSITQPSVIQEMAQYQDQQIPLPFVTISPFGPEKLQDPHDEDMVSLDTVGYGILVAVIGNSDINSLEQRLASRQLLRRRLKNTDLKTIIATYSLPANSNLNTCYRIDEEMGNVVEPGPFFERGNAFVSGFIVRCWFQEPRS